MKKILVTGAAGFIGFHLSKSLAEDGYSVVGIDNFNDYYDVKLKETRRNLLLKHGVKVKTVDLKNPAMLSIYFRNEQPDAVIHLAAYAGVRHSMDNPSPYIQNNIVGTHNLIQTCEKNGINNVVYASTSCVMAGNPLPWNENEKLGYQLNPYGYTKATNESQFMASKIENAVGLRFFTVYGPWGRPDMALFSFTKNIIKGQPINLFNYGNMIRDFTYVDDIVNGIKIVLDKTLKSHNYKEIFNIGYGQQVKLEKFVDLIENEVGRKAIKRYVPKHPADTVETWSDTTKLQQLGYKPTTPFEKGVHEFVKWYKSYHKVN